MDRVATIQIENEVYCNIIGLVPEHISLFYDKYGIFAPNYYFHPRFKLGSWDGKIRFFSKEGRTFVYLLDEILPTLKQLNYKLELNDIRITKAYQPDFIDDSIFSNILHPDTNQPIILRPHQVNAVNALIEAGMGICVAATSAGKTLACSALCYAYDSLIEKSITIVPNQNLIKQTKRDYINCGLDTGEYSGKHKTLGHKHIVSTWQALQHVPQLVSTFNMIIVDECHRGKSRILQDLITNYAGKIPYRFGFTGTLPKDQCERMAVLTALGPIRYEITAHALMKLGVLSTLDINIIQLEEDLTEQYKEWCEENKQFGLPPTYNVFKQEYFGDFSAEKSYIQRKPDRLTWIAQYLTKTRDARNGNVLCLVDSIPFGKKLTEIIPGAIFVSGASVRSADERQQIYNLFDTRDDLVVIATVHIAGEGLSINRIFNLVSIDIGKSFIRVIQAIGRGLRKCGDKDHCIYTDICSDLKYGQLHLAHRIKYYKEAKYKHNKKLVSYASNNTTIDG